MTDMIEIPYANLDNDPERHFYTLAFDPEYSHEIQKALTGALGEEESKGHRYEWSMGDQIGTVIMPPRKVIEYFAAQMKERGLWQD